MGFCQAVTLPMIYQRGDICSQQDLPKENPTSSSCNILSIIFFILFSIMITNTLLGIYSSTIPLQFMHEITLFGGALSNDTIFPVLWHFFFHPYFVTELYQLLHQNFTLRLQYLCLNQVNHRSFPLFEAFHGCFNFIGCYVTEMWFPSFGLLFIHFQHQSIRVPDGPHL